MVDIGEVERKLAKYQLNIEFSDDEDWIASIQRNQEVDD